MKIPYTLLLVGAALLAYSFSLSPYKDESQFMERYMAMSSGQSAEFWKLRDEMLTPKYRLQDYGGTLIILAVGVLLSTRGSKFLVKSPKSRTTLFILSLAAPLLTASAYIFDLFQGFNRGEFPHWADSMSIPLMSTPIIFIGLIFWSIVHLKLLPATYQSDASFALALSWKSNAWLLFVSMVVAVLLMLCVVYGQYWYAVPCSAWLYLNLSITAARRVADGT
jgi:hypothetical protein